MASRKRVMGIVEAQEKAKAFALDWLQKNTVLPTEVSVDDEQFKTIMDTVLRGLIQGYAQGYMDATS